VKLVEVADRLSCKLEGDGSIDILGVATLDSARAGDLSFLTNPKYQNDAKQTGASAILVGHDCPSMNLALLRHDNPYLAFARAIEIFFTPSAASPSIHPTAWISDTAMIGENVSNTRQMYCPGGRQNRRSNSGTLRFRGSRKGRCRTKLHHPKQRSRRLRRLRLREAIEWCVVQNHASWNRHS